VTHHKRVAHRKKSKSKKSVVITRDMRIQKTLLALGFYGGEINGDLNTFETRKAIKKLNESYGISDGSSLDEKTKDQLLYLSYLYELDKDLNTNESNKKARGRQLQAALKIEDSYTGKIDGVVGNGTRKAIANYRVKKGMVPKTSLSEEEKFELLSSAEARNKKNIQEALAALNIKPKVLVPTPASDETRTLAANDKQEVVQPVQAKVAESEQKVPLDTSVKKVAAATVAAEPVVLPSVIEEAEDDFAMPEV
jgi:peptidoglycan hydrolase-like protein with peptidoglycan-binding domain